LFVALALIAIGISAWAITRPTKKVTAVVTTVTSSKTALPRLVELVEMTPQQLENVDIALMNLRCAEGLPGSEGLKIPAALEKLDQYAKHVEAETLRNFHRYRDNPDEFENSEPYFRLLMMAVVMQEDFGIRYNPDLIATPEAYDPNDGFSDDARNVFLNGLTEPPMMGTCSSMPVLYVAVGRRLGYPLYLVSAKAHCFARWDDGRTRLNMEGTTRGFGTYTDEEYKTFPLKSSDQEIAANRLLVSKSPSEELACFLSARSECALLMSRYDHADWCIRQAARLAPNIRAYQFGKKIVERELIDFRNRQFGQLTWGLDHPGEPMPLEFRHPVRKRKLIK
jgi:hypothetical protein